MKCKKINDGWFTYFVDMETGNKFWSLPAGAELVDREPDDFERSAKKENFIDKMIKEGDIMYRCPICGKSYNTAAEMGKCAIDCDAKAAEARKQAEEAKIRAAKVQDRAEITKAYNQLKKLVGDWNSKYDEKYSVSLISSESAIKTGDKWARFPNEYSVPLNFTEGLWNGLDRSLKKVNKDSLNDFVKIFLGED